MTTIRYGDHERQVVDLWVPEVDTATTTRPGPRAVIVLIHGGFWRADYSRDLMELLAKDIVARGHVAWNIEYRPVGDGGGWPETFVDVAMAMDRLAGPGIDLDRVVVVGHSAGGTLALWTAARGRLPADAPGAAPPVAPAGVVSLAGVNNLVAGATAGLGADAVAQLMGGAPEDGDTGRYALADPAQRLPLGVPQLVVSGDRDDVVPVQQTETYAAQALAAGDDIELLVSRGADHFDVINPDHESWHQVMAWAAPRLST